MESIGSLISLRKESNEIKIEKSSRAQITKEIYVLYTSDQEKLFRKKENWKRFIEHCKGQRLPFKEKTVQEAYKKSKVFIKEYDIKTFCIRIAHIPSDDLYYVLSICKDKYHRNEQIGAWLFSAIKAK